MSNGSANLAEVQQRFRSLNLSDCALLGVQTRRDPNSDFEDVVLELGLIAGPHANRWEPGRLTFLGCASLELDIDFWEKRHCADSIAEATCESGEPHARRLGVGHSKAFSAESLAQFTSFHIELVPW